MPLKNKSHDVIVFGWFVPAQGYCWRTARPEFVSDENISPSRYLEPCPSDRHNRYYCPLENPTLFTEFANTPLTEDGILGFASRYGWLGEERMIVSESNKKAPTTGEPLSLWVQEISALQRAIALWRIIEKPDRQELRQRIEWKGATDVWYTEKGPKGKLIARQLIKVPTFFPNGDRTKGRPLFKDGDLMGPAWDILIKIVNKHLEAPEPIVSKSAYEYFQSRVRPQLLSSIDGRRPSLRIVPTNLIGAIWFQFAQAIDRAVEYRQCKECGTWFLMHKLERGKERLYCSDACKLKVYRRRKKRSVKPAKGVGS